MTDQTKATISVHLYGLICDMKALRAVAERHGLVRPGVLSETSSHSFCATKNLTCGQGGSVVTDDAALRTFEWKEVLRHCERMPDEVRILPPPLCRP